MAIIKNEYKAAIKKAKDDAEARQSELYSKIPEIKEIDLSLAGTGLLIMDAISCGKEGITQRIEKIKADNQALMKKRADVLAANGYPADYDKEKYACEKCRDTGYVLGCTCPCMKKRYSYHSLRLSGLGGLAKSQSFENFNTDLFDPEFRDRAKEYLKRCREYARDFSESDSPNLLFIGTTGLGKTHLSTSIAKEIIEKGYYVTYVTAQSMISDFSSLRYGTGGEEENEKTAKYYESDLLIIDDLGTELNTNYSISVIYNVINTRICRNLPMIISTNLSSSELRRTYADRITSRLFGNFSVMPFEGRDNRMKLRMTGR